MGWFTRFREEAVAAWKRAVADPDEETLPEKLGVAPEPEHGKADGLVPFGLRVAAAWSWRLIIIAIGVWVLIRVVSELHLVIVPAAIAILLAAMMEPVVTWLRKRHVPSSLASFSVLLVGLAVVIGVLTVVIRAFVDGFGDLSSNFVGGLKEIQDWLKTGPLHLTDSQIQDAFDAAQKAVRERSNDFAESALTTAGIAATTIGHVVTGFLLVLFTTFFFLKDGRSIWNFVLRFLPEQARAPMNDAGNYAWKTLVAYVRATVLVAFVDAVGIGLAVWLLGVPLALPLAALVFLTAFIPIIGAVLSGLVAVLIALVAKGIVVALLVLAAVLAVQQLEGHVLQPLLMGRAVALHPLAVVLAIAAGVILAGLMGALVAVPFVAVVNTTIKHLHRHYRNRQKKPAPA